MHLLNICAPSWLQSGASPMDQTHSCLNLPFQMLPKHFYELVNYAKILSSIVANEIPLGCLQAEYDGQSADLMLFSTNWLFTGISPLILEGVYDYESQIDVSSMNFPDCSHLCCIIESEIGW